MRGIFLFLAVLLFGANAAHADCTLTAPSTAKAGTFFDVSWQTDGSSGTITRMDGTTVATTSGASGTSPIWATNNLGDHTLTLTAGADQCQTIVNFTFTLPETDGYDIIVSIGQSNDEGMGRGPYKPFNDALLCRSVYQLGRIGYSDKRVVPVGYWQDGLYSDGLQSWDKPENDTTIGHTLSFAQSYAAKILAPHRKVLIIEGGHGSTSIRQWLGEIAQPSNVVGTTLYDDTVDRNNAALALPGDNHVVAILWQQGEADIAAANAGNHDMNASIYEADEKALFQKIRQDISADAPILVGLPVPTWLPTDATKLAFQTAMANAVAADGNAKIVGSTGLLSDTDIGVEGGPVHFNADSQTKLGGRYFSKFDALSAPAPHKPQAPTQPRCKRR
jgi:hypothetical protein